MVVVGLGYVGLPLAIALARAVECWGLDINRTRIGEVKQGVDRTNEITAGELLATPLTLICEPADCPPADFYIVTVPTPVDDNNRPDLGPLAGAARAVGAMLDAGPQTGHNLREHRLSRSYGGFLRTAPKRGVGLDG